MIEKTLKQDDVIMKTLASMNVDRINRVICNTNQGALELEIRKGETKYHFVLGAVPLSPEMSKELMDLLFPVPQMEKPKQVNKGLPDISKTDTFSPIITENPIRLSESKKKIGRPAGSKTGKGRME